MNKWWR